LAVDLNAEGNYTVSQKCHYFVSL